MVQGPKTKALHPRREVRNGLPALLSAILVGGIVLLQYGNPRDQFFKGYPECILDEFCRYRLTAQRPNSL